MKQESGRMTQVKKIQAFSDLLAWQRGHELVLGVYKATKLFPKVEQYGLTSQLTRAVVSITSNIAEGFSRSSAADKAHFYVMAQGSLTEVQNQLIIARDLAYLENVLFVELEDVSVLTHKLLTGLIKKTREQL